MARHDRDSRPEANPGPVSNKPRKSTLTAQQSAAVAHIAAGRTLSEAASLAGVDRKTLWMWRRDIPAFNDAVDQTLQSMRDEVAAGLVQAGTRALGTLANLAERADDESIRLKAATEVLNRIDGAVKAGTTGAAEAAVVVQIRAEEAAAELRKRREGT